jgi:transketolase
MEDLNEEELKNKAKELRKKVLELGIETGEAHFGGSFSEIEILISLYDVIMKPEDKFILSKGHACYPFYLLLKEKGFNPKISAHPDLDVENGIYATTGSLGHGLPMGVGMALARKLKNKLGRIYVLISDGECQEGTTWESAQIAAHHKLDNLVVIVDHNKLQALQRIEEVQSLGNLKDKFDAFGWQTTEVDGHNFQEILNSLQNKSFDRPQIIIAHTIKGKGISYMENNPKWHTRLPTEEELKQAHEELE